MFPAAPLDETCEVDRRWACGPRARQVLVKTAVGADDDRDPTLVPGGGATLLFMGAHTDALLIPSWWTIMLW